MHRAVIGGSSISSWLNIEIGERIERMRVVETAPILAMAAFRLTVVARRVSPDELVPDAEIGSGFFKEHEQVAGCA